MPTSATTRQERSGMHFRLSVVFAAVSVIALENIPGRRVYLE